MEPKNKETEAIKECYIRLFKHSTPSADFEKLVEKADINENGEKVIDFMSYAIEEDKFESILSEVIKEYKISPEYRRKAFKNTIYLGCSPKTIFNI